MTQIVTWTTEGNEVRFSGRMKVRPTRERRERRYGMDLDLGNAIEVGAAGTGFKRQKGKTNTMITLVRDEGSQTDPYAVIAEITAFIKDDFPDVAFVKG